MLLLIYKTTLYKWDANGNLTEKGTIYTIQDNDVVFEIAEGEYWQYEYDLLNRLVRVWKSESGTQNKAIIAEYTYDALNQRIRKDSTAEGTSWYVFGIDGNVLYTYDDDETEQYVYVAGKVFALVTEETTYFYANNHLGTTEMVTDENGQVVWQQELTPFGEKSGEIGIMHLAAKFTGKDFDEETQLYYFNARWYDPGIGRFISEDPVKDGLNWYVYVSNNPLIMIDKTGLEEELVFGSESWAWKTGIDLLKWAFNFLVVENYDDNVIMKEVQKYSRQKVLKACYFFLTTEKDYFHLFPTPGFGHDAPQRDAGYYNVYDDLAQTIFDINGTKFDMGDVVLRLWKGDYHAAGGGGEIGFYGDNGRSLERNELEAIGLKSTTLAVYLKNGILIGGYDYEEASFWTTSFNPITNPRKEDIYTVNTLKFETEDQAQNFANELENAKREALKYPHNHNEYIDIVPDGNTIVITWGKPEDN